MNNNLQLVLKSSTTEMSLNDHDAGIYLTPELDGLTGLPEIRTTSGVNAGYDGGWTSAQKFDARSIVIRGTIANNDKTEVERMRRELVALLAQGKNEQLELDFVTETGRAYEVQVRTIACDMALQKVLTQQDFMITLRADDPLIYDNSSAGEEATVNISGATGGFRIPFEIPLAIDAGSEETVVENTGLESVAPTVKMYGALHNPKIINHTTNQSMQIQAELGFAEGDWITPSEPVEGKDLSINGAPENALIADFGIKGNTSQQTYTGKNLCGIPDQTFVHQNVTVTIKDGEVTMNGTATGTGTRNISPIKTTTLNGSYTTSLIYVSGTAGGGNFNLRKASDSSVIQGTQTTLASSDSSVSYTITSTDVIFGLYILSAGTVFTNYKFKIQIVAGSTPDYDFEPYTAGASPNPDYPQAVRTVTGENVVKVCGKNLFNTHAVVKGRLDNGVIGYASNTTSLTANDNSITFTVDAAWRGCISEAIPVKPNTEYHMKATSSGAAIGASLADYYSEEGWISRQVVPQASLEYSFTTPANCKYVRISWQTSQVGTATISNPQLELGSSATAFEAFSGQSYEVNLGKNLLDIQATPSPDSNISQSGITYTIGTDGTITTSGVSISTYKNLRFDLTLDAGTYFFSGCPEGGSADGYSFVVQVGSTLNWDYGSGSTFTLSEKTTVRAYVVRLGGSTGVNMNGKVFKPMIVKGSTPTSFAPYFTPIELCKIGDYRDYIYKSDGKWYVHKDIEKVVLDGVSANAKFTERMTANNSKYRFRYTNSAAPASNYPSGTVAPIWCDMLTGITMGNTWNNIQGFCYNDVNNSMIASIESLQSSTLEQANTWLASNNMALYYTLATPTDTEITNETLVAQLEALAAATMYSPQTNITTLYAEGNEQPTLDVSYFTDKNPDTRDELVIDSRLRTITLNGLDVYHLQAPGSEFLMLAPGENKLSLQSDIVGDNGYAKVSYKQGYLSI